MSYSDQNTLFRLDSAPIVWPAANRDALAYVNSWYARAPITASATRSRVPGSSPHSRHSRTSRSAEARKRPGERSVSPRSFPVVDIAIRHPLPGSPMTSASGTKTRSRNSSANAGFPSSRPMGRTVTPGARRSNMR